MLKEERGSALVGAITLVAVMTLLGLALFQLGVVEDRLAIGDERDRRGFYTAEAGMARAFREVLEDERGVGWYMSQYNYCDSGGRLCLFPSKKGDPNPRFDQGAPDGGGSYRVTFRQQGEGFFISPQWLEITSYGCVPAGASDPCPPADLSSAGIAILRANIEPRPRFSAALAAGDDGVRFGGSGAMTDSWDSSLGTYNSGTAGYHGDMVANGGNVKLEDTSKVKGNVRNATGNIELGSSSVIEGRLEAANEVGGHAVAGGTITPPPTGTVTFSRRPNSPTPKVPINNPTSAKSVVETCGPPYSSGTGITSTPPGAYNPATGKLKVASGQTVELANGQYCFESMDVDGTVNVSGPVTIWLLNKSEFGSGARINNSTLKPENLQILSSFAGLNDGIKLKGGGQAYLTVYAPRTEVILDGIELWGAVAANKIDSKNGAKVHFDEALRAKDRARAPTIYLLAKWRDCDPRKKGDPACQFL